MKLVRYGAPGAEKPGIIDQSGQIRDISHLVDDIAGDALLPEKIAALKKIETSRLPVVPAGTRIGPCVGKLGHFIAIGLNYVDHAHETGAPIPAEPIIFDKAPNSVSGPHDDIVLPRGSMKGDWEVELAIIIGKGGLYIDEAKALDHVAGFALCNDVSERELQIGGTGQWTKGKSFPSFGPLGPWLVTSDEIGDVQNLDMWCDVNGERMQTGNTRTMIFPVAHLVAYTSRFMRLDPGDVITTGTPPGVGMGKKPPRFLKAGDRVKLHIQGLGTQEQLVRDYKG
ncbi:fumarylacetoacetate hydrolase family protein [Candidatus Raskinella chloraquaticus]|jgi:2,4-didehydro-3-deoxy-L-rhamnonate hydrolase|uniref:2-hydroxyhepta-2,4-diene-1,7-dioate isomerase n=1 Tax=Candidatus Raskinella chloraquaticus TaxID=1951219 RepID=A0A1W9HRI0_9HYPH|nr:MAG: 2-hydroxyhepta-2,4-diene-1,7-dioate isomerase [Proteobacteria bacterium SG_bin8]